MPTNTKLQSYQEKAGLHSGPTRLFFPCPRIAHHELISIYLIVDPAVPQVEGGDDRHSQPPLCPGRGIAGRPPKNHHSSINSEVCRDAVTGYAYPAILPSTDSMSKHPINEARCRGRICRVDRMAPINARINCTSIRWGGLLHGGVAKKTKEGRIFEISNRAPSGGSPWSSRPRRSPSLPAGSCLVFAPPRLPLPFSILDATVYCQQRTIKKSTSPETH